MSDLCRISLEFEKEYKNEILNLIEKRGWNESIRDKGKDENYILLEFYDDEKTEEDIKEFKPYCDYIYIDLYSQEECVYSYENEDDELTKIVKIKMQKDKNENNKPS